MWFWELFEIRQSELQALKNSYQNSWNLKAQGLKIDVIIHVPGTQNLFLK